MPSSEPFLKSATEQWMRTMKIVGYWVIAMIRSMPIWLTPIAQPQTVDEENLWQCTPEVTLPGRGSNRLLENEISYASISHQEDWDEHQEDLFNNRTLLQVRGRIYHSPIVFSATQPSFWQNKEAQPLFGSYRSPSDCWSCMYKVIPTFFPVF